MLEATFIHELFKYMNDKGVVMSYSGDFNFDAANSLLFSVKNIINSSEMDFLNKKRFYAIVAETLDNVSKHSFKNHTGENAESRDKIFFNITETTDCFSIQAGNYIHKNTLPVLSAKLEKVNSLDKDGLKSFYRDKLSESPDKGGGLGIIDMSIRSGSKITYEFKTINESLLFFIIQTTIKK